MQFSLAFLSGSNSFTLNYTSAGNLQYLVLKEPSSQPVKTTWFNTILNNGNMPDSVFRSPIVIGAFRYYVSRIPVVLDATTFSILFDNGSPTPTSPIFTSTFTETVTPSAAYKGIAAAYYALTYATIPTFIDGHLQLKENGVVVPGGDIVFPGTGLLTFNAGSAYSCEAYSLVTSSAPNPKLRLTVIKDDVVIFDEQIVHFAGASIVKTGIVQPGSVYRFVVDALDTTDPVTSIDIADNTPVTGNTALQVLNVSPGLINTLTPGFIDSATEYYTVQIGLTSLFRFDLACEARYEVYRVHFLNKFGGFETRNFSKVSRNKIEINKSSFGKLPYTIDASGNVVYYNSNNVYNETTSVYASQYGEGLTLNTDILTDDEYTWLGDLILSPLVYVEREGYFLPANITDTNYEFKKQVNDKLTNLTIEIKFGDQFNAQYR
jgi:hypothetical protein